MNKITNHLPTAELQALDAAHHMHPFSAGAENPAGRSAPPLSPEGSENGL